MLIPVDHKQYGDADRRQLSSNVSRHKPVQKLLHFFPNFNARNMLNSERHLSVSSGAESKQRTSLSKFAIFLFLPPERNVRMTLKRHIWHMIDSSSLTAPIRNSVGGRTEFCKTTMTSGRRNLHSPTPNPLFLFDRRPPP